jgi:hypothetical protein
MPRDWVALIDKRAAVKEQFPRLQQVIHERPGCQVDRDRQAANRAANLASVTRSLKIRRGVAWQEEDAVRFIAEMKRREHDRFMQNLRRTA